MEINKRKSSMLGKYHSEETKQKMSKVRFERKKQLGYINSPEARKRMSIAQKKRFENNPMSKATKRKISEVLKGKNKPPFTEEHRKKLSEALRGKPQPWNAGEKSHFWRGGAMKKVLVKCVICGKINLIRKGRLEKLTHPYKCLSCSIKGRIVNLETRRKLSLAHRKYNLDETFFGKIDTEEKAYWLGFFAGDGTITDRNRLKLRLAFKDGEHLKKFKNAVKWTGKDYYHKHTNALEVSFRSLKMTQDLACYFVTSRKTYTVKFPDVPKLLEKHFIRGVFDADGCINKAMRMTRGKSGQIYICYGGEFNIESNKEFASAIQGRLVKLGLPLNSLNYPGKRINRVRYGGINQLRKIYNYLYEGATIFLERKKKLFEEIFKNYHYEVIREGKREFRIPKLSLAKF